MTPGSSSWMKKPSSFLSLVYILTLTAGPSSCLDTNSARHHQHDSTSTGADLEDSPGSTTEAMTTTTTSTTTTTLPPIEKQARLHQAARLQCDLLGEPRPTSSPTWRHGDQLIVDESTAHALAHRYFHDPVDGQLHIANVRLEDAGLWQCQEVEPETGQVIAAGQAIDLIVTEPPLAPYFEVDGRRLDPGNVFLPVTEDAALSVWCVVEGGHPAPEVAWRLLMSSPAPPLVQQPALSNASLSSEPHHHVRSEARLARVLRAHHNATITCLVHHVTLAQPINASLLLDVQYTPSFVITREPGFGIPLIEGIAVSLKCDVDSNPPSNPVWLKDDGAPPIQQSVDGYLNFSAIRREHSGWYKCTSREYSSIGYFLNVRYDEDADVTVNPEDGEVSSTGRHVEVALGGAVQLQCPASGGASCWSRVGAGGKLEPVGMGPELSLERVLYQEAGTYRCVRGASPHLEEWRSLAKVDLSVTGAPAVYPSNRTLTAMAGQEVTLSVEFCANPRADRTIWLTDRILLRPGEVTRSFIAHNISEGSSPYCHKTALTFRTLRPTDAGEYVFLVRSPKGLAEGSVMVNVTTASGFSVTAARGQHAAPAAAILYIVAMLSCLLTCVLLL